MGVVCLGACGSTRTDPSTSTVEATATENAPIEASPTEATTSDETTTTDAVDPLPPAGVDCASHHECTILRDACGAPHARPLGRTDVPPAPDPCPPADYALVEPSCDMGRCALRVVEQPEWRACQASSECILVPWACGGWWAVMRAHRREAEAHVRTIGSNRACGAPAPAPRPTVECVANVCITRGAPN